MPYYFGDERFRRSVDLHLLVMYLLDQGLEEYRVSSALELVVDGVESGSCGTCGMERPLLTIDSDTFCLYCREKQEREFVVTLRFSGTVRVYVTASNEDTASEMAMDRYNDGDVDLGDSDDVDAEVDSAEVVW